MEARADRLPKTKEEIAAYKQKMVCGCVCLLCVCWCLCALRVCVRCVCVFLCARSVHVCLYLHVCVSVDS